MGLKLKKVLKYANPQAWVQMAVGENLGKKWNILRDPGPAGESANAMRARIAREQWADYKQRFQPIENKLIGYAQNPKTLTDPLKAEATGRINSQYGMAPQQIERRMESYGLQVTPEMQNRIAKRLNYDKGLAQVQADNQINRFGENQLYNIVGAGTGRAGFTGAK